MKTNATNPASPDAPASPPLGPTALMNLKKIGDALANNVRKFRQLV